MNKTININTILLIAVAVLVTIQVTSMFRKSPPDEKLIRAEMEIKHLEEKRLADSVLLVETRGKYDSLILIALNDDKKLQGTYNTVKRNYEKIPVIVGNLSDEELRRAIYNFRP